MELSPYAGISFSINESVLIKCCMSLTSLYQFTVVFHRKCRHKKTGVEYAVKVVSRRVDCSREVKLLKSCQGHPNIVKLQEVYHDEVCYALTPLVGLAHSLLSDL